MVGRSKTIYSGGTWQTSKQVQRDEIPCEVVENLAIHCWPLTN